MLILASASPRRKELLQKITPDFEVIPSHADETVPQGLSPMQAAEYLSAVKAKDISRQYPGRTVIGADTVVELDGELLGKPKDYTDCVRMITALSGRKHSVYTGITIISNHQINTFHQQSDVIFYPLSSEEIISYASTDEPYDKAGAYGIQGHAGLFVERIEGDYFNIMGLPAAKLYRELKNMGII